MQDDFEELLDIFDGIKIEMTEPDKIYESLTSSLKGTSAMAPFLSLLQHLLLIRRNDVYIAEKYYQLLDTIVAQIVLDKKGKLKN